MRKLRFRKGREKAQDYINKWQERGSSPSLVAVQSPCLKCQQALRLASKTQQTWTWTMVARGFLQDVVPGWSRGGQWNLRNFRGDRRGALAGALPPLASMALDKSLVKDSTNQAKTVVWAVIVAGERIWSFPTPLRTEPSSPPWPTTPQTLHLWVRSPAAGWGL